MTRIEFIETMQKIIHEKAQLHGMSQIMEELAMCQAALESGFGSSEIMMSNNAPFGIKSSGSGEYYEVNTKEYVNGQYITVKARFRKYPSLGAAVIDYFTLMKWSRYAPVTASGSFEEAAEQIRLCGYATSPVYTQSLIKIHNEIYPKTYVYTHIVNTEKDNLNVRQYPGINSKILTSIPRGTKITVNSDWSFVEEYDGFVFNKYLKEINKNE